ncbi:hypothetical protein [Vulgatibacter incomptus]|uniref:Outer membrane protein beta-barrel domain-containing protein n=1 Tax=Vulgatibacter incomptus TaxID=1391653 RepID=A0A0K1PCV4_9BACT|nr:hypothetical protein [Vulgatibacter incomptus]AKU90954.1 hypothetical protein AKJ08_1341 [Vulgatibacter incomptus]
MRSLLALSMFLLAAVLPIAPARGDILRVGLEGGVMGPGFVGGSMTGPVGLATARIGLGGRMALSGGAGMLRLNPEVGDPTTAAFVPVTLQLRLDVASITPYIGAGASWVHVFSKDLNGAPDSLSALVEAGLDVPLAPFLAAGLHLMYGGLGATSASFGASTLITAGLSIGI